MITIPHTVQSKVIQHPINKVWEAIRGAQFPFWKLVDKVEIEMDGVKSTSISEVGSDRKVYFKDGTVQVYKILEISDFNYSLIYMVTESEPSTEVMSAVHTIKAFPDNTTFVEWRVEFTTDADLQVVQDAQYKKLDGLKDLSDYLAKN